MSQIQSDTPLIQHAGKRGARVGGRDGESASLGNFVEGWGAFAELDSLARRMPRPLELDFDGDLFFFFCRGEPG